jgi:hypothetical protein
MVENFHRRPPVTLSRNDRGQGIDLERLGQLAILIGTLGLMLALIGLFPSVTGVEPKSGIGLLQILVALLGLSLLIGGALLFAKITFYPYVGTNLAQQIAVRLSLTGLLITAAAGLADLLGFGSHPPNVSEDVIPVLGPWQASGMVVGFLVASVGVVVFTWMGPSGDDSWAG